MAGVLGCSPGRDEAPRLSPGTEGSTEREPVDAGALPTGGTNAELYGWHDFDETQTYLMGSVPGPCPSGVGLAVVDLRDPRYHTVGFPCETPRTNLFIRDGRLIYTDYQGNFRTFESDAVYFDRDDYPDGPIWNDPIHKVSVCTQLVDGRDAFKKLLYGPDGFIAYQCVVEVQGFSNIGGPVHDLATDEELPVGYESADVLGGDDLLLGYSYLDAGSIVANFYLIDPETGDREPLDVPPGSVPRSFRWSDDGFHFVAGVGDGPRELWELTRGPTFTKLGEYPAWPSGEREWYVVFLDDQDVLYSGEARIQRRTLNGDADWVYYEGDVTAKVYTGTLFGPGRPAGYRL